VQPGKLHRFTKLWLGYVCGDTGRFCGIDDGDFGRNKKYCDFTCDKPLKKGYIASDFTSKD